MLEAIIFDMDGVLFDTERLMAEYWYQAAKECRMPAEKRELVILESIGLNQNDIKALFTKELGEDFPYEDFMEKTTKPFHEAIEKEGIPVKTGVYEILQFLEKTNLKVGIASSSSTASIKKHLKEGNITEYFAQIIGGDTVKHSKPQPDIYINACKALGVNPANSIAVEDSPNGIKSAYAAGMKVVMIPDMVAVTPELEKLLYRKFVSLLELMDFLAQTIFLV